jgi:hypothetical protein
LYALFVDNLVIYYIFGTDSCWNVPQIIGGTSVTHPPLFLEELLQLSLLTGQLVLQVVTTRLEALRVLEERGGQHIRIGEIKQKYSTTQPC